MGGGEDGIGWVPTAVAIRLSPPRLIGVGARAKFGKLVQVVHKFVLV